jgi:hypothetical protein
MHGYKDVSINGQTGIHTYIEKGRQTDRQTR